MAFCIIYDESINRKVKKIMNPESKIKNAGRMNVAVLYEDDVELPLFPDQNKSFSTGGVGMQSKRTVPGSGRKPIRKNSRTTAMEADVRRDIEKELKLFAKMMPDLPGIPPPENEVEETDALSLPDRGERTESGGRNELVQTAHAPDYIPGETDVQTSNVEDNSVDVQVANRIFSSPENAQPVIGRKASGEKTAGPQGFDISMMPDLPGIPPPENGVEETGVLSLPEQDERMESAGDHQTEKEDDISAERLESVSFEDAFSVKNDMLSSASSSVNSATDLQPVNNAMSSPENDAQPVIGKNRIITGVDASGKDAAELQESGITTMPDLRGIPSENGAADVAVLSVPDHDFRTGAEGGNEGVLLQAYNRVPMAGDVQTSKVGRFLRESGNAESISVSGVENVEVTNPVSTLEHAEVTNPVSELENVKVTNPVSELENVKVTNSVSTLEHAEVTNIGQTGSGKQELYLREGTEMSTGRAAVMEDVTVGNELDPGMKKEIRRFGEEVLFPDLGRTERTDRTGELSVADWGEELLVLLPELQELTDRGDFVTGRAPGDIPELHEILGKLTEASDKLERISSVIEKFEQEYRT